MRKVSLLLAFSVAMLIPVFGQGSAARKVDNDFVQQQFGKDFTLVPEVGTVIDPYYDFFGYGDPKVTTTFSEPDPVRRGLVVLIIHGAGPDGWRSATPKAKYVIVNLPYRTISVRKMKLRKKTVEAVYVEEAGEFKESSALVFDGKKFRYVPMGGEMQ